MPRHFGFNNQCPAADRGGDDCGGDGRWHEVCQCDERTVARLPIHRPVGAAARRDERTSARCTRSNRSSASPQDVLDELFRDEVSKRRPRPQGKRLWAEMAAAVDGSLSFRRRSRLYRIGHRCESTRDPDCLKTLVCLMDGERKLWDLQHEWLGRSVEILDFFHVLERVRQVSKVVHPQDKSRREVWVTDQTRDLLNGKVETVIRRWRRLQCQAEKAESWTPENLET